MTHKGEFVTIAKAAGLERPWRATHASPALKERLNALIDQIGPYPHARLDQSRSPVKKDGTRLRKVVCRACGYTIRTTAEWIETGLPTCACGEPMEVEA